MAPNAKKMKLLVTGASGFIGYEVARQLSIDGYKPRLMIRIAGDDCEICHFDADFTMADLRNHRNPFIVWLGKEPLGRFPHLRR